MPIFARPISSQFEQEPISIELSTFHTQEIPSSPPETEITDIDCGTSDLSGK
jgi:hypothetical protein